MNQRDDQEADDPGVAPPFWRAKRLAEMTTPEWESLCDGCGRCCLVKLEDEDDGSVHYTDVACRLLDLATCRCRNYPGRAREVPDCLALTPAAVAGLGWLPPTCAYRLLDEGRDLPHWHPLVTGDPATVHAAGVSVRGRAVLDETQVGFDELPGRVVSWPGRVPRAARRPARRAGGTPVTRRG